MTQADKVHVRTTTSNKGIPDLKSWPQFLQVDTICVYDCTNNSHEIIGFNVTDVLPIKGMISVQSVKPKHGLIFSSSVHHNFPLASPSSDNLITMDIIILLLYFYMSLFQLMEEYDWGEFAVITSLLPGYDTFVDIVQSYTDTSYFLWNLQDVLSLEMSVGSNDARTKRMLQQVQ